MYRLLLNIFDKNLNQFPVTHQKMNLNLIINIQSTQNFHYFKDNILGIFIHFILECYFENLILF